MHEIRRPLSRPEVEELTHILASAPNGMPLSKAHGFLAAVISAPTTIMPSVWQSAVLGDLEFASANHAQQVMGLVMRFYNQIVTDLNERKVAPPIPGGEGMVAQWCEGYLEAVRMDEVWTYDEEVIELIFPISVLSGEFDLVGEEDADGKIIEDPTPQLRRCREVLGRNVVELNRYWTAWRRKTETPVMRAPKTGRNDPCPCGSGLKYKKCCALTAN